MSQRYTRSTNAGKAAHTRPSSADRDHAYVRGNAVRQLTSESAPAYEPRRERPQRTPEQEQIYRQKVLASRRNRQKAQVMNRGYVIFLAAATLVCALFCGTLIYIKSDINENMQKVSALETQVSELKTSNDALEKRLETSFNLDQIKQKASGELGMHYPQADQIVTYSVENSDYMNQYSNVPED